MNINSLYVFYIGKRVIHWFILLHVSLKVIILYTVNNYNSFIVTCKANWFRQHKSLEYKHKRPAVFLNIIKDGIYDQVLVTFSVLVFTLLKEREYT